MEMCLCLKFCTYHGIRNVPGMLLWSHEASQPGTVGEKGLFPLRQKGKKSAKPRFDLTGKCNWAQD